MLRAAASGRLLWNPAAVQQSRVAMQILGQQQRLKRPHRALTGIPVVSAMASAGEWEQLRAVATEAAEAGAAVISRMVDQERQIEFKGAADLVTSTDKASEAAVMEVLMMRCPDHGFLGEEGGVSGNSDSPFLWAVDPLDGTTNFAHSYPAFACSVAVLHRASPVAACVVEFSGGPGCWVTQTYTAHKSGGASCNGRPLQTTGVSDIGQSLLVTGFGYDHGPAWQANMQLFQQMTGASRGVRRLGAAAVDLCHVAAGRCEAYWEFNLKPWDCAAGVLICQEAGGKVSTLDGRPFTVFDRSILASNGALHGAMLSETRPSMEGDLKEEDWSAWFVPPGYEAFLAKAD